MRVRVLAAAAALIFVVGACGNAGDDSSSSDTKAPGGGTTPTSAVSEADLKKFVPSSEPGVDDDSKEIRVSIITSKTNPIGGKYGEYAEGVKLFFDKVNSEGGIYGRKLVVAKERDDVVGLKNQDEVRASLAEDNAFATFLATLQFTGAPLLDEAGQPTFHWNINPEMAGHPNIFGSVGALCFGCPGHFLPWLARAEGLTKVGILGYGVSASSKLCAEGTRKSYETYAPDDVEVVFFDDTLEFSADVSAQVAEMKDAGVEFVNTCMDTNQVFKLQTEMKKQGLDAVQYLPNAYDPEFLAENSELFEGAYLISLYTPREVEPQSAATKEFVEWVDKKGITPVELVEVGWINARTFYEGLKMAGPEFTRAKVIDSLNTLTDWTADGLTVPIDWTKQHEDPAKNPDQRSDYECSSVMQIRDGKFVPIYSEPGKPWVCFDADPEAPIPDMPEPTSFAPDGVG